MPSSSWRRWPRARRTTSSRKACARPPRRPRAAMVQGDRVSRKRVGHGNAIAMPYHHVILPLCSRRDKITEVRWGVADFRRVFGREPAGMWLPETAVDRETLDVLAEEGI